MMNDLTKVSVQMRDTGEIVREDVVRDDQIDQHLMYLDYFWGMDMEGSVDKTNMWVTFYTSKHRGMADIFFLPV